MEDGGSCPSQTLEKVYPICRSILTDEQWTELCASYGRSLGDESLRSAGLVDGFPEFLDAQVPLLTLAPFLPGLACAERAQHDVVRDPSEIPVDVEELTLNPTLVALELDWKLAAYLSGEESRREGPEPGKELLLVWRAPDRRSPQVTAATERELLVMKMAFEGMSPGRASALGQVAVGHIRGLMDSAAARGIAILPRSRLRRSGASFEGLDEAPEHLMASRGFTLQWHLTNACELHCRHCYDRTQISPLTLDQARGIVTDLVAFCRSRRVAGHASLTGGNPFLFRGFMDVYRAISETDLDVSILGNPVSEGRLAELVELRTPSYFQVSLEGLEETNDVIRGPGHFRRVMDFLPLLREAGIRSAVMLTLGRQNIDQALPLAEHLRGRADVFNFNRLCQTGEGSSLDLPSRGRYAEFLGQWVTAARSNPVMAFKDNLFNILRHESEQPLLRGCTGHGCGAAFDFVALLPDGEAHACRKLPSPIGSVLESGLEAVYAGEYAERYRQGCLACSSCPIRPGCGGCLAVTAGEGRNPFEDRDPHCFVSGHSS